jgi:diaminopimelate decarboxylase
MTDPCRALSDHEDPSLARRLGRPTLERLHDAHGSAFYLLDLVRLRANLRALLASFRRGWPCVLVGHSYKTNYLPPVVHTLAAEGVCPEVVSPMEYAFAMRAGQAASRVIVNGPAKPSAFLEEALCAGALVNADSLSEVDRIVGIAHRHPGRRLRVGLRCNISLPGRAPSRFGLDTVHGDLDEAARRLRTCPGIEIEGLHCHVGGDRSAASYGARMQALIALADRLFPQAPPAWLDVGGGFAGPMPAALARQFTTPPPSYDDYAREITAPLRARYGSDARAPTLIIEPGMGLLADIAEFVCQVEAVKRLGDRWHAIASGSLYNIRPTLNRFDLPTEVIAAPRPPDMARTWTIGGSTCMEIDVMHSGLHADLAIGDDLVFRNTGAYTIVLTPPFINPAPAIVAVDTGLRTATVRRTQTPQDVLVADLDFAPAAAAQAEAVAGAPHG